MHIHARDRRKVPNMYSLALPLSPYHYQMAQSALKEDLELCSYTQCGGLFKEIYGYIPAGTQLSVINRFVALLKDEIFDGTKESSNKIMAVLEAECPRTIEDAIHVVRHLGDYQVLADRDAYGKKLMGQYGAVLTEHGIVMSRNWKCEKLNEENVTNQVRWVLEIKSHGELTTVELDAVKSEWKAQCFEGGGREFEDVRITKEDDGELYVLFDLPDSGISITIDQELKGELIDADEMSMRILS